MEGIMNYARFKEETVRIMIDGEKIRMLYQYQVDPDNDTDSDLSKLIEFIKNNINDIKELNGTNLIIFDEDGSYKVEEDYNPPKSDFKIIKDLENEINI